MLQKLSPDRVPQSNTGHLVLPPLPLHPTLNTELLAILSIMVPMRASPSPNTPAGGEGVCQGEDSTACGGWKPARADGLQWGHVKQVGVSLEGACRGGFREGRVLEGTCSKGELQNKPQAQGEKRPAGVGGPREWGVCGVRPPQVGMRTPRLLGSLNKMVCLIFTLILVQKLHQPCNRY